MALFDFVQSTTTRATSAPAPVFGSAVTAGSIIIVDILFETDTATVTSVADNKGNTYTQAARVVKSGVYSIETWYSVNVSGGSSFTVTVTGSAGAVCASIHEYLGNATVSFDAHNEADGVTTVNVTTTGTNDLMHGLGASAGSQPGAGSGYTRREAFVFNDFHSTEDKVASGTGSITVDFTANNAQTVIGTAFKTVTTRPFQMPGFPNPRGRAPIATGFLNPAEIHLLGKDKFFAAAGEAPRYDYPNPRGRPFPIDNRTFINPMEAQLLSKDKFFSAAGEPPTYDYPNPRGRGFSNELRTFTSNALETTLSVIILAPFSLNDWPNPRGASYPSYLRTFINSVEAQLIGKDQFFGAAGEPPAITDWPVPKGRIYPVDLRTFLNPTETQLIGQDQMYGAPGEVPVYIWVVPTPPRRGNDLRTWLVNLLGSTLGGGPIADFLAPGKNIGSVILYTTDSRAITLYTAEAGIIEPTTSEVGTIVIFYKDERDVIL